MPRNPTYKEAIAQGICYGCRKRKPAPGKKRCPVCLDYYTNKREVAAAKGLCRNCGIRKPLPSRKLCQKCANSAKQSSKKHYLENLDARKTWNITRKLKKFNITIEEALAIAEKQGGVCAICGKGKPLCFDHDHTTGLFRGFLCDNCNSNLSHLENATWKAAAEAYLHTPPALNAKKRENV